MKTMSEIRVKELRIGKGITHQQNEHEWHKSSLEVLIDTEGLNEVEVAQQHKRMEQYLDRHLGIIPTPLSDQDLNPGGIPNVDTQLLMQHAWKGKRKQGGGHHPGTLEWGWDFPDNFPKEILACLPITLGEYEFTLDTERNVVNVQKAKP